MSSTLSRPALFQPARGEPAAQTMQVKIRKPGMPDAGTVLPLLAAALLIIGFGIAAKPLVLNDLPMLLGAPQAHAAP